LIPRKGVIARYHQLELPSFAEGFDALYTVQIDSALGQFTVEEWKNEV
jgi:hypothetical protein